MLEVRRVKNIGWTKRFKFLFGQPTIEHLYQSATQHVCLHNAAIEKNVRRACQPASPPPNVASFRTVLYLLGQKARQVFRNRRIGGIRQAQFLKSNPTLSGRHFVTSHLGKESFHENAVQIFAQQLGLYGAPN
jgi:hypothetical protein